MIVIEIQENGTVKAFYNGETQSMLVFMDKEEGGGRIVYRAKNKTLADLPRDVRRVAEFLDNERGISCLGMS